MLLDILQSIGILISSASLTNLEGLHEAVYLINVAADRVVVHIDVAESALGIDDEGSTKSISADWAQGNILPEGVAISRDIDAVVFADLLG